MKFSIAVNMERSDAGQDMHQVARDALELVRLAEQGVECNRQYQI